MGAVFSQGPVLKAGCSSLTAMLWALWRCQWGAAGGTGVLEVLLFTARQFTAHAHQAPTLLRSSLSLADLYSSLLKPLFTGLRRGRGRVGNAGGEVWIQESKTGPAWGGKTTLTVHTVGKSARQCRFSSTSSFSLTDGFSSSSKSKVKSLLF